MCCNSVHWWMDWHSKFGTFLVPWSYSNHGALLAQTAAANEYYWWSSRLEWFLHTALHLVSTWISNTWGAWGLEQWWAAKTTQHKQDGLQVMCPVMDTVTILGPTTNFPLFSTIYFALSVTRPLLVPSRAARTVTKSPDKSPDRPHD